MGIWLREREMCEEERTVGVKVDVSFEADASLEMIDGCDGTRARGLDCPT